MRGEAKTLYWLSGEKVELSVPFFQRSYVWDTEDWDALVKSIRDSNDNMMPFLGSLILQKDSSSNRYLVIDGQQRLTTLSIMIKSILDVFGNDVIDDRKKVKIEDMIYQYDDEGSGLSERHPRLLPSNIDRDSFETAMGSINDKSNREKEIFNNSRLGKCYHYFIKYFSDMEKEDREALIGKITTRSHFLIVISLDENDYEQSIFDTVNSLGKGLTNSDIIKNFLYQHILDKIGGSRKDRVIEHYKKYWERVFCADGRDEYWDFSRQTGRISITNLDAFLKDFAIVKGIYDPEMDNIDGLAKSYKRHICSKNYGELIAFSEELAEYAECFYQMRRKYEECDDFRLSDSKNMTLLILDKLECSTFNPYVLSLVKENDKDIDEKFKDLQRFLLKRFLWKATNKNYNKCCGQLLKSRPNNPADYYDEYNANTEGIAWDAFPEGLLNIRNNPATLILFIIEAIRREREGEDKYDAPLTYNKSLEHIMPQKWEKNWKSVQSWYLNTDGQYIKLTDENDANANRIGKIFSIGNMTLLPSKLNTSISNGNFEDKINGRGERRGMRTFVGSLSIAKEIVDEFDSSHSWDERNIYDREKSLFDELNEYYSFVDEIRYTPTLEGLASQVDDTYFTDEYLKNKRIGNMVVECLRYLMLNSRQSPDDIKNLRDRTFSSENLSCAFPVLVPIEKADKTVDSNGRSRYYKKTFKYNGSEYYMCREWFEHDRKYFVKWFREILAR